MIVALLRHLLESTVFAAAILIWVACLRRNSAATRHALLLCAVCKFALPLQWLFAAGAWLRSVWPAREVALFPSQPLTNILQPAAMQLSQRTDGLLATLGVSVWIAVASLLLIFWLRKLFATVAVSDSNAPAAVMALECMKARIGFAGVVRLRTTAESLEPRLYGLWRQTVVLPESLPERLSAGELEAVLLHELAHARRHDNLKRVLAHTLSCLFWFYPFLRWLERRLDMECELACDELVLSAGANRQEYLEGILKVCKLYVLEPIAGSSNVSGSNLKQRMEVIMSSRIRKTALPGQKYLIGLPFASLAAVAIFIGFNAAALGHAQSGESSKDKTAPISCLSNGEAYFEGSVVKRGNGPQQMCVRNTLDGSPLWVKTSDAARERSRQVISLPEIAPYFCKHPTAGIGSSCTCETNVRFSRNATVLSHEGALTCGANGRWQSSGRK